LSAGRLRALVLSAGLGTRLRPLTDATPKPLLPVAGRPVLAHTLAQLAAAGCEAVAINLHHQGEEIRRRLGGEFAGMPLTYSVEPELLGTLGALYPLRGFFAPAEEILLVNGDSLCAWPFRRLLREHRRQREAGAAATLLLALRPDPAEFGGGVGVDREGRVLSLRRGDPASTGEEGGIVRRLVFAGAHALEPALLARVGPGPADIVRDLYVPLLAEGGYIASLATARRWHDLGTPRRFLEASLDWARAGWPRRLWQRSWVSPEAALAPGAQVRGSAVEGAARVERRARVERSVLLPGARVGEGSFLREVILGAGAAVPAGSWVERRLVTARRDGAAREPGASVVGGEVYTPLDPAERAAGARGAGGGGA
jgi:mannose-1-phosphate guanylyltransferase